MEKLKTIKKPATEEIIQSIKTIGFEINENQIKYKCITREQPQIHQTRNIQIGENKFEKVHRFKYLARYLGTELNSQNNNHKEIKERL